MRKKKETVPFIRHYSGTYAYHKRMRRRILFRRTLRVLAYAAIFLAGYFFMELLLQISLLPPA